MKILVTGVTGFVGSQLARLLLAAGHEVHAIIRPSSDTWRIRDIYASLEVIERDLADHSGVREGLRSRPPEMCIHPAWRGWSGPSPTADENLSSLGVSLEFLRTLFHLGCRRFVGVGSCFEYETDAGILSEDTPARPKDLYGFCKHSLHVAAQHLAALGGMEVAWARVFIVYGPYDDAGRLIPSVTLALLQNRVAKVTPGEQVRDFTHVEDAVSAIWAIARSSCTGPVNVASGVPVTVAQVAQHIAAIIGKPELVDLGGLPYRPGEPKSLVADTTLLRERIGWRPRYDLEAGLKHTVEWWMRRAAVEAPGA